jgi:epoxyqueuosine reductase
MKTLNRQNLGKYKIIDFAYTEDATPQTYPYFQNWVNEGYHQPLSYLGDERKEKRESLKNVFSEFESALVFLFDYKAAKKGQLHDQKIKNKVASYVLGFEGFDYHFWIKDKLDLIVNELKDEYNFSKTFYSIDAQPVLERDLAFKSGLGWFGKNSMLISKSHGSYFLIASIFFDQKLKLKVNKHQEADHCGTCTRCLDACPTDAILKNRTLDSQKCISTYTIELFKDETQAPQGYAESGWVYGCDICQEVCPWNHKPLKGVEQSKPKSQNLVDLQTKSRDELISLFEKMSNREFKRAFKSTPLERTGRVGLLKNLKNATSN